MNKHGFLLAEETLKLIISVIAIGFLAYFLVSLYFSARTSQELEQAKETLPFLMNETIAGRTSADIYNPKGWLLGSWPHVVEKGILFFKEREMQLPKTCSNLGLTSCICLCEKDSAESCDNDGICLNNEGFLIEGSSIKIENPPLNINIDQTNKILKKAG